MSGWGAFLLSAALLAATCRPARSGDVLSLDLMPATETQAATIRLNGLSSSELRALDDAQWSDEKWQALFGVRVQGSSQAFVAGQYVVEDEALDFRPSFPFDPGRPYVARFDPSRLPTPRAVPAIERVLALPGKAEDAATMVTGIDPAMHEWPENVLRFYVHFSGPMSRNPGVEHVHILDDSGQEVPDALLESPVDFWSPDQRRTTVFFDPGRVKSGLVPNRALGRVFQAGRRYTIVVDAAWPDAAGRPLTQSFRKEIRIGPEVNEPIRLADWRITVPAAGTREPVVVSVPWALDHALFARALGVEAGGESISGDVSVVPGDREWRFVPAEPWRPSPHALVILSVLEDVSGNLIDQAFEVTPGQSDENRPERYTLPFTPVR